MSEEARYEEAYDMVVRLATTLNAYEYVAFTSKSTNMGTYVYNALSRIPEQYRGLLINELSDKGGEGGRETRPTSHVPRPTSRLFTHTHTHTHHVFKPPPPPPFFFLNPGCFVSLIGFEPLTPTVCDC